MTEQPQKKPPSRPATHALRTAIYIIIGFLVYAYAVEALEIDLREPLEPNRQTNAAGVLRKLAQPDLFTFNEERRSINVSIHMPCPEEVKGSQVTLEERAVTLAPNCATTTQDTLTLTGTGFWPNTDGVVRWYPPGATSSRALARFRSDGNGGFTIHFNMVDVRPSDEPQRIEIEEIRRTGISGLSDASKIALDRIVETILMALMASTIGTLLAVPVSFLAARNLMVAVTAPLAAVMGALVALPIGAWLVGRISGLLIALSAQITGQAALGLGALALSGLLIWPLMRVSAPAMNEGQRSSASRVMSAGTLIVTALVFFFALGVVAHLGLVAGLWLQSRLGAFDFIGTFFFVVSDFLRLALPALMAFIGGLAAASIGSRYGQEAVLRLPEVPARLLTFVLSGLGVAVLIYGVGAALDWFYQFDNPALWTTIPAAAGGVAAALASLLVHPKRQFPIGFVIYTATRTVLNALRSIEPLIIGIIFVVWVGIGPFAGVLALTLHSIAALGKLFSEQVESISPGPLEAITATGANRIQTIVYAVVPQIIPPYIAFTFYRWDINVRMSTIIGFVGGGGIGLVLNQYINLLRYRQASVMLLAIAIVVSVLDYVSSKLRSKFI